MRGTALCAGAKTVFEWSAQAFLNIVLSCACRESDFQDKSFGMFWACQLAHDSWPPLWWSSRTSCQAQQACLSATLDKQMQGDQQAASASLDSQMKDGSPLIRKFCYAIMQGCPRLHCSPTRSGTTTTPRGATWCNCHWLEIAGGRGLWRILGSCISIQNLLALLFFAEVRVHRSSLHVTTLFL